MNLEDTGTSLGALLAAARERRGLPLEQAAHDTRIRVQRLRDIESDDLSQFSHPSYARMFIVDYARYLGVSPGEIRDLLPESGACGTEGYQYLQETPVDAKQFAVRRVRPRRSLVPAFAVLAAFLALGLGGLKVWKTMRDIDRLGLDRIAREDSTILDQPETAVSETGESLPEAPAAAGSLTVVEEPLETRASDAFAPVVTMQLALPEPVLEKKDTLFVGGSPDIGGQVQ
ncbi:MAG TPA: helix-turn-helix domain-containing protein [Terrimicrobiaceae bacterium]|nr:helix-turn-helix domain-containing protein [Terrimicrobiaceae bacterium]